MSLSARLAAILGPAQASREIVWMQKAAKQAPSRLDLPTMLSRRVAGEPLQYILGTQPFGSLDLLVRPPVLIPRPETEEWTIRLTSLLSPTTTRPISMLDLGTGTGCIPLLLCNSWTPGSVHADAVDISQDAINLASENALRSGIPSASPAGSQNTNTNTFRIIHSDYTTPGFLQTIKPPYDLLTANPPYISEEEYGELPPSVKDFEDRRALAGGRDGLQFYREIAQLLETPGLMNPNAVVALEIGHTQASAVERLIRSARRVHRVNVWRDAWGKDRTVVARMCK